MPVSPIIKQLGLLKFNSDSIILSISLSRPTMVFKLPFIYSKLIEEYKGSWLIPCVHEVNPYVQVIPTKDSVKVLFSKYKEPISSGYHDLSLFYGNIRDMLHHLQIFRNNIWNWSSSSYKHKHGNEMTFLDVFNETDIKATIIPIENYISKDFNTVEEYKNLISST